jgi:methyl-accepting chemotaxis protein
MASRLDSVRTKMLLPALAAVAATLVATVVTQGLARAAGNRLAAAEERDFPALEFFHGMHTSLARLDGLLRWAGEGDDFGERIGPADILHLDMLGRLQSEGVTTLDAEGAKKIEEHLEAYYTAARADAEQKVQDRTERQHAAKSNGPASNGPSAGALREGMITDLYDGLYNLLDADTSAAREAMKAAFHQARSRQQASIWIGAACILAAMAISVVLAAWLSARTAGPLHALSEVALRIADGDLTPEVHATGNDEVGVLARSFQRMSLRLRELVGTLKATAQELAVAAEKLSDHTRAQSALLERQAAGVAETSTTTRELEQTSSVAAARAASVLDVAKRAAEMSEEGRAAAERSAEELRRIQGSVDSIVGQSSHLLDQARQVGDIVETVRDLATQSHVLSLNASIEAARAGEAGKSFAVVAQEVRALAEQSGQSAGRIAKMVQDILTAVQSTRETTEHGSAGMSGSLDQIRASGESLRQIGAIVRETSDAALHIASAVQQQSTGIGQIAVAMRDLDKGMEETIGRIRTLELSAQAVGETAMRISGIAAEFKV